MLETPFLTINGNHLENQDGQTVILRGFGLGGWMNMENFITGYPANEEAQRDIIRATLGQELYERFFDQFLANFFTEADARLIQSLGLNLVRIPVNYRHFEDDERPFEIKPEGFRHLDRVVEACARHGIYTIIDLHAVPGYQNQDWHSDNPTHKAFLWKHKHFQDRLVHLWEVFADHFKSNPWVAGYNPINEPYDPSEQLIEPLYRRIVDAIRAIDPHHIIFLEGNRYSLDFHMFHDALPGVMYTNHDYTAPGFIHGGPYPGETDGVYHDKAMLEAQFLRRSQFMLERGLPVWVGEFGPVYLGDAHKDAMRYQILKDQLDIYHRYGASWSIWTYKDLGLQGLAYTDPNSPWMERTRPLREKKALLGADAWGSTDAGIQEVISPLAGLMSEAFPDYNPGPFGAQWQVNRLVRHLLLSEALLPDFARLFAGMDAAQIDRLMESFLLENCQVRQPLAEILAEAARRPLAG